MSVSLTNDPEFNFYLHIPFCKSLCSFCGCTKMITSDKTLESPLIQSLLKEFGYYRPLLKNKILNGLHLGGGSPTWLSSEGLKELLSPILNSKEYSLKDGAEISIELDPRTTSKEFIKALSELKFTRVSLGVQDLNPKVLKAISRNQSYELIKEIIGTLRENNLNQINLDLVIGLPFQTLETITDTMKKIVEFSPSRLALYSYAHVPSLKPSQKSLEKIGLPSDQLKLELFETAKNILKNAGYVEVGMDHFVKPTDELYLVALSGKLHRNFMGYTTLNSPNLIGLGPSSLSNAEGAFAQNEKDFDKWKEILDENKWPIVFGHVLTQNELITKKVILDLMCNFKANFDHNFISIEQLSLLKEMEADELLKLQNNSIQITDLGKTFVRQICKTVDLGFSSKNIHSQTI